MIAKKTYSVILTTLDPFRVGGKSDPLSEAENPVAGVGGRVCVPGSTLKGAYRAELERWLNEQYYDTPNKRWKRDAIGLQPCIPSTKRSADEDGLVNKGRFRDSACHYPCDIRDRGKCREAHSICPACYLLGAQQLVGFTTVPFLFTDTHYEELYSARLERTTRTVMKGTNRPYQLIPPESKFGGELEIIIRDEVLGWELGRPRPLGEATAGDLWLADGSGWSQERILKELVEDRLKGIGTLGGYRSKGFGGVKIELSEKPS